MITRLSGKKVNKQTNKQTNKQIRKETKVQTNLGVCKDLNYYYTINNAFFSLKVS